jgi:hypothetical protein
LWSSSILSFNRTIANVVCRKTNTWLLSFHMKNMMGWAFVVEAWGVYDVHCLNRSLKAMLENVGKLLAS